MTSDAQNSRPLPAGDLYEAVRAFVGFAGLPALPPEHILQGWHNHASPPAGVNDYAVIGAAFSVQHGTPVEFFEAPDPDPSAPGVLTVAGLVETAVRVDFCAEDDTARQRAFRLAVATRSSLAADFLNQYGFSPLYADDPRDLSFVGDANQFIRRWTVTMRLCGSGGADSGGGAGLTVEASFFDRAAVSRIENVDVHHPATRSE